MITCVKSYENNSGSLVARAAHRGDARRGRYTPNAWREVRLEPPICVAHIEINPFQYLPFFDEETPCLKYSSIP